MATIDPQLKVSVSRVESEVGAQRFAIAQEFFKWLLRDDTKKLESFRLAPSIVARSEIAVLGLSSPRFVYRAYVCDENNDFGFINLRRLSYLKENSTDISVLENSANGENEIDPKSIIERNSSCIADSVLRLPSWLEGDFFAISSRISSEYGEQGFDGIPYMQAIQLGGGVCAQSCIWMGIAAICHELNAMHGPGEVSCISELGTLEVDGPLDVNISGLSMEKIQDYLGKISASGVIHGVDVRTGYGNGRSLVPFLLRSYVLSGIPLLVSVDLGRLGGKASAGSRVLGRSVFERNELPILLKPNIPFEVQHHAVLVVGCDKENQSTFLINDPSSCPFLKANVEDLIRCRNYNSEYGGEKFLVDQRLSAEFRAQPFLPSEINLFLTQSSQDGSTNRIFGLDEFYASLADNEEFWEEIGLESVAKGLPKDIQETEVRLLRTRPENPSSIRQRDQALESYLWTDQEEMPVICNQLKVYLSRFSSEWVWLQRIAINSNADQRVWLIWDASTTLEFPFDGDSSFSMDQFKSNLLVGVVVQNGTGIVTHHLQELLDVEGDVKLTSTSPKVSPLGTNIIPRVLTSCFPQNLVDCLTVFRHSLIDDGVVDNSYRIPLELYVAMNGEISSGGESIVKCLAENSCLPGQGAIPAKDWVEKLNDSLGREFVVEGLASFVPEAVSNKATLREDGFKALSGLQEIALWLNELGHDVSYIEFVGGTIFSGISRIAKNSLGSLIGDKYYGYSISIAEREQVLKRLAHSVYQANSRFRMTYPKEKPVPFLAEWEPGPVFSINSIKSMENLMKFSGDFEPGIQIHPNLDVSHVRLLGKNEMDGLAGNQKMLKMCRNIHISGGHNFGHIGDSYFHNFSNDEMVLLQNYVSINEINALRVTLEFEAAPSIQSVVASYKNLKTQVI